MTSLFGGGRTNRNEVVELWRLIYFLEYKRGKDIILRKIIRKYNDFSCDLLMVFVVEVSFHAICLITESFQAICLMIC